jgi:starvation-inducible DNA-binding protein
MTDRVPMLDPKVADDLQATLVDLIDLALQAKQAHWNVTGPNFRSVHLQLDEMMTEYRAWSDVVAERIVAIVGDHDVIGLFVERLEAAAQAFRDRMDRLGDTDPVSQDTLIEIVAGIEKQLWMVRTQLA